MNARLDLDRLRSKVQEKPSTKVGQVRQAWPEIKELLAAGHSVKDIWSWLQEIGLEIGYNRLSQYVAQLRRCEEASQAQIQDLVRRLSAAVAEADAKAGAQQQPPQDQPTTPAESQNVALDPLRNLREQRARKKTFEYSPFPTKELTQ